MSVDSAAHTVREHFCFMSLTARPCDRYQKRFHKFDKEKKGFITTVDVQQVLEVSFPFLAPTFLLCELLIPGLVFILCRASMSTLMKTRSMKSLTRWTSTRTDKWKLTSSCRYITDRRSHLLSSSLRFRLAGCYTGRGVWEELRGMQSAVLPPDDHRSFYTQKTPLAALDEPWRCKSASVGWGE